MGLNTSKYVITKTTQLKDTWYRLIFNNTSWKKIYDNVSTAPGSPTFQNFIKEKLLERGFLDVDFGSASSVSWMLDGVDDVRIRAEGGADSLNYFLDWTGILRVKIPGTNCVIKFKDKNNNVVLLTPENEQYQIGNISNGTWQSQYQKDLDPNLSNEERWVNLSRIGAEFAVAQDETSEIKNKGIFYLSSEDERYYQTNAPNPSTDHKKWFSIPLYEVSFGIEQVEPYTWTTEQDESWTPNQLKFPSMVNYSNILTEDNSDSGNAVLLPETSGSANANNYEQDENGNCYVKDNEGNVVYNKLLNKLARKTKINNGYRINGNQSLELLSFGNNIYDVNQKTEGQFLFKNNKKQNYGLKKDDNVSSTLQQNIPYFGGQPAIYPIIIYSTMESIESETSFNVEFLSDSVKIKNNTFSFNPDLDAVAVYIREPGTISDCSTTIKSNIKKEEDAGIWGDDNLLLQIQSIKTECTIKGGPMSSYKIKDNKTFWFNSIPTDLDVLNQNESNIYTKIIAPATVDNLSFEITKNGVRFHSYGGLGDNIGFSIGKYNFPDKNDPSESDLILSNACTWTNNFNFLDTKTILKDFSLNTKSVNSSIHLRYGTEDLFYTGGGDSHKISETDFYFDWLYTLSNIVPGIVPGDIGITTEDKTATNWYTYSTAKNMSDSSFSRGDDGSSSHEGYLYNIRYRNQTYQGNPNYLKFNLHGFIGGQTADWRYAIAIVIWKNGKLLENS